LGKETGLSKVVALSAIAAALSFILLHLLVPELDMGTKLFISLGLASSVGAIVAMDRGAEIGEVTGFVVLLLLLFIGGRFLPSRTAIVFALPNNQAVVIDVWFLPLLFLGLIALFALVKYLGGDLARFGLWTIVVALTLAYYAIPDVTARILIAAAQALIVFLPAHAEAEARTSRLYAVTAIPALAAYDRALVIDLTQVNVYAAYLIPILALIALDPFNKVPKSYRSLAAVVILMIVFLQIISLVMTV
jgi:hypothetical protein